VVSGAVGGVRGEKSLRTTSLGQNQNHGEKVQIEVVKIFEVSIKDKFSFFTRTKIS